jgi:nucleoside-diphosphate-sugar epimerase
MATILVTGGAGFIGSHVVELIQAAGDTAVVVDDLSKGSLANLPGDVAVTEASIADRAAMQMLAAELTDVKAIIHCAAQASVVASTEDPEHDLRVNIAGTINVLDIAAAHACPLVFTSTGGAIYGETAPRPTPETSATEPGAPYGASKAAAEIYVRLWARRDGLPHTICRLGNVYGPRQRGDGEAGVVAIFASRLRDNQPMTLYGFGEPTRDYVHVHDVARALVGSIGTAGTYNIATGTETSVREVHYLARTAIPDSTSGEPELAPLRPGELQASCLDTTRAADVLGWSPEIDVATGIPSTVRSLLSD